MRKILMLLAFAVALPGTAVAQDWYDGVYVELRGGASFLTDSEIEESGFADIDADFDVGWLVDGAFGYAHDSGLRGEVAVGFRRNEFDELESGGLSEDVDGHISAFTAMFNGYYDFHLKNYGVEGGLGNLSPFIGGGLGVAVLDTGGDDIGDEEDTVFAYQAIGGLSYHFTPNIAATVSYAYFATSEADFGGSDTDYDSHNVMAGIRYSF